MTDESGPKIPPEVRSAYLGSIANVEWERTMIPINQGIASWDDLESLLDKVRGMLDDADGTKLGQIGKLLDDMATCTDKAKDVAKRLRSVAEGS